MKYVEDLETVQEGKCFLLFEKNRFGRGHRIHYTRVNKRAGEYIEYNTVFSFSNEGEVFKATEPFYDKCYEVRWMKERYMSFELTDDEILDNLVMESL